ncbi:Demethylsterigmatocystin 6-O-methyltransferase [Talaromyces islandicus]|uniref:Demethylsterigmatocystin 6-O-methyltransferase n=1 Tax=Talaromyces islandicus TaxID=28573 RepID=A0A0U1LUG1_TALIS|nr:Demethylsterigmatocystin 6-O-methyltransferase [Talaromyces islandicus]
MAISELIEAINSVTLTSQLDQADEQQRAQLFQACDKLKALCESPLEKTMSILFSGHQAMAIRLGVDLKLFDALISRSSQSENKVVSVSQMAEDTKADPALVGRILKFLASMSIVKQLSPDTFFPTRLTAAYVSTSPLAAAVIHFTHFHLFLTKLPEYFAQNGWKNPRDIDNTPFQFVMGDKLRYFDYLSSKPYYQNAFNTVMTSSFRRPGKKWVDFFPVEEKLHVQDRSHVLLVDVGGGHGSDLLSFREKFPHLSGKLVLQDLPHVIETANIPSSIEGQGYDFFDEQPVKGAKAYYLRTVLHDWPDAQVVQILARLRDAMDSSSILLIEEKAMPETDLPLMAAVGDMTRMVEDYQFNCGLVPFGSFDIVTWTSANSQGNGAITGVGAATPWNMVRNGNTLVTGRLSGNDVVIAYG